MDAVTECPSTEPASTGAETRAGRDGRGIEVKDPLTSLSGFFRPLGLSHPPRVIRSVPAACAPPVSGTASFRAEPANPARVAAEPRGARGLPSFSLPFCAAAGLFACLQATCPAPEF
jgi:hypothetical protein